MDLHYLRIIFGCGNSKRIIFALSSERGNSKRIIFALSSGVVIRSALSSHYLRRFPLGNGFIQPPPQRQTTTVRELLDMAEESVQPTAEPRCEPAAAKARGSKWPPGVEPLPNVQPIETKTEGTKYYARLSWLPPAAAKKKYDSIPGLYASPSAAAQALRVAQAALESVGPEAVWPQGLPGSKQRMKRDAAYWDAEAAARAAKAEEKAAAKTAREAAKTAAKAAREAAEAARPKKPRKEKPCQSTAMPCVASQVHNSTMRAFLQPLAHVNAELVQPLSPAAPLPPIPVPAGLEAPGSM